MNHILGATGRPVAAALLGAMGSAAFVAFILMAMFLMFGPLAVIVAVAGFFSAALIAIPHALLLGLPLHALLRLRGPVGVPVAVVCGFVIGALPAMLHLYPVTLGLGLDDPNRASGTFDWLRSLTFGVPGAVGGLVFLLCLRSLERNAKEGI